MSTELAIYQKLSDPLAAIQRLGQTFAKSGMFGCDRPEQGEILALICMTEQKSPVQISRDYDIVEGKLRKKALAALAEFRTGGGKHKWLRSGDEVSAKPEDHAAELELTDKEGGKVVYRYSMADAKAEGLIRNNSRWTKRPGNMLRARCISNGLGMLCPEIYAGSDDSDSEPAAAPELKMTASATVTQPATVTSAPPAAPIMDAEIVAPCCDAATPAEEKELAAKGLAPAQPANPPTQPVASGKLNDELFNQLVGVIGQHVEPAVKWMVANNWLKEGDNFRAVSEVNARKVIAKSAVFLKKIGAQ